jgi:hypothetical protein
MVKLLLTAIIFFAPLAAFAANGQSDGGYVAPELSKPAPGHLLDQDYLTSTGETVPRPGVPQSSVIRRSTATCASRTTASTTASAMRVEAPADRGYFRPVTRSIASASP